MLGYLKCTREYYLHCVKYLPVVEGHIDVNLISDMDASKSTGAYVFTLRGGVIF